MEIWVFVIGAVIFAVVVSIIPARKNSESLIEKKIYNYTAKPAVMTPSEILFFKRLSSVAEGKYIVFPQIHISAFIDFKVKGQNWKAAFRHINGKSVDYLLCDINTLHPKYAVELDDWTHTRNDRVERDIEVERILQQAGVPLVRFENNKISEDEMIHRFTAANIKESA